MGLFDIFTGGSKPSGTRVGVAELREALLAVNREGAPWHIHDGAKEKVDLVAEWKIVDAAWYEIFAKAGIKRVFKILSSSTRPRARSGRSTRSSTSNGAQACRP